MDSNAPLLPTPENLDVHEGHSQLTISYRWMKPAYYFTLAFSILWCGIWAFKGAEDFWARPLVSFLIIAIGILMAYSALCGFLNKTIIEVNSHSLTVWHEPLPWSGAKQVVRASVKQLYTVEHIESTKNGHPITYNYQVEAITTSGKSIILVSSLETAEQAQFIERKIEKYLDIENQAVEGEDTGGVEKPKN